PPALRADRPLAGTPRPAAGDRAAALIPGGGARDLDGGGERWEAGRLQQQVEALAEIDDLPRVAGKPRMDPLRALKERQRGPSGAADRAAAYQPAGVDEADLVEDAAGRGEADRDRAQRADRG